MSDISLPAATILEAFEELKRTVTHDLRIQYGDAARLNTRKQHCLRIRRTINQVSSCAQSPAFHKRGSEVIIAHKCSPSRRLRNND